MQAKVATQEQLAALTRFATEHGRTWKSQLREAWMSGNYVGFVGANLLQQIRNQFGPTWLANFNLKAAQVEANKLAGQRDWETCHTILSQEAQDPARPYSPYFDPSCDSNE